MDFADALYSAGEQVFGFFVIVEGFFGVCVCLCLFGGFCMFSNKIVAHKYLKVY